MAAKDRIQAIKQMVANDKKVAVSNLSSIFQVTEETIRRDLSELERKGILTRSHGGALAAENPLPATRAAASALPVEDSQ